MASDQTWYSFPGRFDATLMRDPPKLVYSEHVVTPGGFTMIDRTPRVPLVDLDDLARAAVEGTSNAVKV